MNQSRTHRLIDYLTTTNRAGYSWGIEVKTGTEESVWVYGKSFLEGFSLDSVEELKKLHQGIGEVLEKLDE